MLDRKVFFDRVRLTLFDGGMLRDQVEGMSAILTAWEDKTSLTDLRWLAYMLATAYHETARTMQPIEEYGKGEGRKYSLPDAKTQQIYYGRGFVQLTWADNYAKAKRVIGADFVGHPELALQIGYAVRIMFEGMIGGWFTGKKLNGYFNENVADWLNARRIVNGTDCAAIVAGYGRKFYEAILAAGEPKAVAATPFVPPPTPTMSTSREANGALVVGGISSLQVMAELIKQIQENATLVTGLLSAVKDVRFILALVVVGVAGAIWYWRRERMQEHNV